MQDLYHAFLNKSKVLEYGTYANEGSQFYLPLTHSSTSGYEPYSPY